MFVKVILIWWGGGEIKFFAFFFGRGQIFLSWGRRRGNYFDGNHIHLLTKDSLSFTKDTTLSFTDNKDALSRLTLDLDPVQEYILLVLFIKFEAVRTRSSYIVHPGISRFCQNVFFSPYFCYSMFVYGPFVLNFIHFSVSQYKIKHLERVEIDCRVSFILKEKKKCKNIK